MLPPVWEGESVVQTPAEKQKKWRQSEKGKKWLKEYSASPKEQARKRRFQRDWRLSLRGRAHLLYYDTLKRIKTKGDKTDLTKEWFVKKLADGKCQITGAKFDLNRVKGKHFNPFAPSIDKVNPKKGYTKRNCKIVLWGLNNAKAEMSMKEFKAFIKLLWEGLN